MYQARHEYTPSFHDSRHFRSKLTYINLTAGTGRTQYYPVLTSQFFFAARTKGGNCKILLNFLLCC